MDLRRALLQFLVPEHCMVCARPAADYVTNRVCSDCWSRLPDSVSMYSGPFAVDGTFSLGPYDSELGRVVRSAKYGSLNDVFDALGRRLGASLANRLDAGVDVITNVPIPRRRRWNRGFDQGEVLGRAISRSLNVPYRSYLGRRHNEQQVGKTARQRRSLSVDDFTVHRSPVDQTVLLVDDVRTTGATLSAAAEALVAHGAERVWAVTVCINV